MIRKFSILLFLFSFFITQVPLHAKVICIEEDGHVEVEAANNGVCTSSSDELSKRTASSSPQLDEDHCGTCTDIPISIGSVRNQKIASSKISKQVDSFKSVTIAPSHSNYNISISTYQNLSPIFNKVFLSSLHSTILII